MPNRRSLLRILVFLFVLMLGNSYRSQEASPDLTIELTDALTGSWHLQDAGTDQLLIIADNYIMHTIYSLDQKKFELTKGGTYKLSDGKLNVKIEFFSSDKSKVGTAASHDYKIESDQLTLDLGGKKHVFKRIDNGNAPLTGNWNITGRMQGDKMGEIVPGDRKTIKLLSGTKFQWAAINTKTGEFFGTGGGTYTFENGKYTENIEFFSRDNSRVGASLSFEGALENGKWIHKGLSSKGDQIHEVWSRVNVPG
ncbi:MAG: membrane or secreted protein [Chitinophagaceae bacterium]|nr:MAG: membrane or secreted protein [Chitinophagaceae bacterium]